MSADKENPKNGDMEVEEASSEETPDTPENKPMIDSKDSDESPGKVKEKEPIKKKTKGKEVKKDEKDDDSNDGKDVKDEESGSDDDDDEEEDDDDDDEEDDGDADTENNDGKVPLLDQPLELSGTRERKKVQRFTEEYKAELKDIAPVEIPEGKGTPLGNIVKIEANIQKVKADDLKPFHRLLFNRAGKSTTAKRNIRKFNGFDFDEKSEQYAKKKQMLIKLDMKSIKGICSILELKKSSKREELVELILNFLMKPEGLGKPVKPQKKRGSRSNKSYSESEEEEKRPQNRRGKMKRANLKEVSTDEEDFDDGKNIKDDKDSDEENDKGSKKERKSKSSEKDNKDEEEEEEEEEEDKDANEEENDDDVSSDDSEGPKAKRGRGSKSGKNNKASTKKANSKKAPPKKVEKKSTSKKRAKSDDDDDESSEDEPLVKKGKTPPTDEEIKSYVKQILEGANLEETTMKIVCKQVYAHYPDFDLAHKKDFIKTTVKSLIST